MIKNMEHFLFVEPGIQKIGRQKKEGPLSVVVLSPGEDREIQTKFEDYYEMSVSTILAEDIKRFSPILVRHNDHYLRQVTFYAESGRHKLTNREKVEIKTDDGIFFLTYPDVRFENIDEIDLLDSIENIDEGDRDGNKFRAIGDVSKGDVLEIEYKLRDSFSVVNREGIFEIQLFSDYDELEVIYETNMETPFHSVDRRKLPNDVRDYLNINPHFNDMSSSFLFITDREYEVREVETNYETMKLDIRRDSTEEHFMIKAKLKDRFGNPVYTQAQAGAELGEVTFYDNNVDEKINQPGSNVYGSSDMYGNVYIKYFPPADPEEEFLEDQLTITAGNAEKTVNIDINYQEKTMDILPHTVSIRFPYHKEGIIIDSDTLAIEVFVGDTEANPLKGEEVSLKYKKYDGDELLQEGSTKTKSTGRGIDYFTPKLDLDRDEKKHCYVMVEHEDETIMQDFKIIGTNNQ